MRIVPAFICCLILLTLISACKNEKKITDKQEHKKLTQDASSQPAMVQNASEIPGLSDENKTGLPLILELGSSKCVPCKLMKSVLDGLSGDFSHSLNIRVIDVNKDKSAVRAYGITMIPVQIFFSPDGQELFRHQGFYSREEILKKWNELGYEFTKNEP